MAALDLPVEPLAHRLRPRTLAQFVGQQEVVGEGSALRRAIEQDALRSVILTGPPGTGKTTLAHIIAEATKARFEQLNAVTSGVKELKAVCEAARDRAQGMLPERTVLFIDEIHRFNRSQQDALLPYVEQGTVTLIGATTQNPYFEVNAALVSRSYVVMLKPLGVDDLTEVLRRALSDPRGFGGKVTISDAVLTKIATVAGGDARTALNTLELAVVSAGSSIDIATVDAMLRERGRRYDRSGEDHYNSISAFIKTMRGSDPDAALLWLFRMLAGGEDPKFLFRRMAIFASEDVGNADPRALPFVISAWQAFEFVGLPEGEYFLAHACVYLSQAPKSNAVTRAMGTARKIVADAPTLEVPNHLRNAPLKGMKEQGYGDGYVYPHSVAGAVVPGANYFPIGVAPQAIYEPTDRGFEVEVAERLEKVRKILGR